MILIHKCHRFPTGLGEIYQWVIKAEPNAKKADGTPYQAMDLREIQDWIVRPQLQRVRVLLKSIPLGDITRPMWFSPDLKRLQQLQIPLTDLQTVLTENNENRGAGFIEENGQQLTVRIRGMLKTVQDDENVTVSTKNGLRRSVLPMLQQFRLDMIWEQGVHL